MPPTERAIHATWNVGVEDVNLLSDADTARGIGVTWNVGVEAVPVAERAIHATWNVGVEIVDWTARAIHAAWNITLYLGVSDPCEWRLVHPDFVTIIKILEGK